MLQVIQYIADDGTVFDTAPECSRYEIENTVAQIKWERDTAMETLKDIGIPFGHKYKDITDEMGMNSNGINLIAKLLNEGNARVIQTGGFTE